MAKRSRRSRRRGQQLAGVNEWGTWGLGDQADDDRETIWEAGGVDADGMIEGEIIWVHRPDLPPGLLGNPDDLPQGWPCPPAAAADSTRHGDG